jgi:hypothetical protein
MIGTSTLSRQGQERHTLERRALQCNISKVLVKFSVDVGDNGGDCHGDGECH